MTDPTQSGWLVGVDAGGTNSRALAVDAATGERREARGEGANWTVHGAELCRQRLEAVITAALPTDVRPCGLCLGVAGYYPPDHRQQSEPWLTERWPEAAAQIVPDMVNAWAGAFAGEPGVIVVAGTGSIAYGRNSRGEEARAGGWGPTYGDEGSAFRLGIGALRLLSQWADRGQSGCFAEQCISTWPELGSDLISWLRGINRLSWRREQIAQIARLVVESDDREVASIAQTGAFALAHTTRIVIEKLGDSSLPVALFGGLAESATFKRFFSQGMSGPLVTDWTLVEAKYSALEGSVLLAAQGVGGDLLRQQVALGLSASRQANR